MAPVRASILAAVLAFSGAVAEKAKVTPIQKVLQMLGELQQKGRAEKEEEAVKFAAFSQWCDGQVRVKTNEIEKATASIEKLTASIEKDAVHIKQLTDRILELEEDVGRWKKDQAAAQDVRNKESEDYRSTSQDYSESINAIAGALSVLKGQAANRPQALIQVQRLRQVPESAKQMLAAYIQQGEQQPEMLLRKAPEAHGYEFQSGGVIELLKNLKDEFAKKKYDLDAEELGAQHAFEQVYQQLTDLIEAASHEINKKTAERAQTEQSKAQSEKTKAQTESDRAEDQKYLDETNALCAVKRNDFASRQKLREEELQALAQAEEIIGSGSVAGAGAKHLPSLIEGSALVQLRSSDKRYPAVQTRIALLLAERAQQCGSKQLSLLSEEIAAAAGPFDKIKKMVQQMIIKLTEEARAEAEHKGWCDAELAANTVTRNAKTEAVNELTAEVESLTAEIAKLARDIKALAAAVAELDAAMAQETEERQASKAKNTETIAEAKEAQRAVKQAIGVLQNFYAKAAQATALAQVSGPAEDAPETFDAPYQGLGAEGGSVLDFLEVILSDFARLESDTTAAEASEEDEYKRFMFESEKDKALKLNESKLKSQTKVEKESALHSTKLELKSTQEELDAAEAYYQKLKPTCVDSGISYEETVKRREAEMQSLQEALTILKNTVVS